MGPLNEPLATVFAPKGVPRAMGFYHDQLFLTTSRGRCETSLTTAPNAPGPALGGGRFSRERLAGGEWLVNPGVPL